MELEAWVDFGGQMAHNMEKQEDNATEIYFIARGEHLKKIQEEGLTLNTPKKAWQPIPQLLPITLKN